MRLEGQAAKRNSVILLWFIISDSFYPRLRKRGVKLEHSDDVWAWGMI